MAEVYAVPNESKQYVNGAPNGSVDMGEDNFRPEDGQPYICQDNGDGTGVWVINTDEVEHQQELQDLIDAYNATPLKNLTVEQALDYVDNNWSTIANSRVTFKLLVELVFGLRGVIKALAKLEV